MTLARSAAGPSPDTLHRAVLVALAVWLLVCGFGGRLGVQVVDTAVMARVFALHRHGIAGEDEYIRLYGEPAPFVHPHCHAPLRDPLPQPGPDEVHAAASLAGAVTCTVAALAVVAPPAHARVVLPAEAAPEGRTVPPILEPPR